MKYQWQKDSSFLTTSERSETIAPNVIDMTGPINGDTSIAAVIFGALFSIRPKAANELKPDGDGKTIIINKMRLGFGCSENSNNNF